MIVLYVVICAAIVVSTSALSVFWILFLDRRFYVRQNGIDPIRVVSNVGTSKGSAGSLQTNVQPGLDPNEWI